MLKRFAPLVPMSFVLLAACASHAPEIDVVPSETQAFIQEETVSHLTKANSGEVVQSERAEPEKSATPELASSILERAFELIGTPYRYGGTSEAGFDCSGFVRYLFGKEAGIRLPRTTREMLSMNVPLIPKQNLLPGDVLFFNNAGRGRVSHTGIYIGDGQFIHSASYKGGGVRVDHLDSRHWRVSYMEAKRLLDMTR